jgi:hypothetical protein
MSSRWLITGEDIPRMAEPWRDRLTHETEVRPPMVAEHPETPPEPHARHGDPLAAYEEALGEVSRARAALRAAEARSAELRAIAVSHPLVGEAGVREVEVRFLLRPGGDAW